MGVEEKVLNRCDLSMVENVIFFYDFDSIYSMDLNVEDCLINHISMARQ